MSTIKLLENLINYCSVKNSVISKNLANIGTENYQREDVVFKDILSAQVSSNLKATKQKHIGTTKDMLESESNIEIISDRSTELISGINNVDIEKEMSDLAENTIQFKFAARKVGDYYKNLQRVIRGGSS